MHLLRTWVTEGCNAFCPHCMNINSRSNYQMDTFRFEQMCKYFQDNGFDTISIMGGEPTIHPDFEKIMSLAQSHFSIVYLFTNGLNSHTLKKYKPRENDTIIYNSLFINKWIPGTLMLKNKGKRIIDVVINQHTKVDLLTRTLLKLLYASNGQPEIQLTIDNSTNIFLHRAIIAKNINEVYDQLVTKYHAQVTFQCGAPMCFTYGLKLPPYVPRAICPQEAVLVDGNFDVRFCNIQTDKLINLFNNNDLIPFHILKNHIYLQSYKNQQIVLDKICRYCLLYGIQCNGKCHVSQNKIKAIDIINNTSLPWIKQLHI